MMKSCGFPTDADEVSVELLVAFRQVFFITHSTHVSPQRFWA
jgi:hypothetical protein